MTYSKHNGAYLIRLMPGEEVIASLQKFCADQKLDGGFITGLGGARLVEIGSFSMATKQYTTKQFVGDSGNIFEVTNLTGNIAIDRLHLHVTIGDHSAQAFTGHLMKLVADPTVELMITPFARTQRTLDDSSGLNLLELDHTL